MQIYIAEALKQFRAEKGVSQEKLAQYLNVSFQAVSKWENGNSYPDITLLPEIARFFGVTVDALLQTEKVDEQKLYAEYEEKACEFFRNGDRASALSVWQEAYRKMPNNLAVKEMLMSSYYDTDKIKYKNEIIALGTELYNASLISEDSDGSSDSKSTFAYYRGQAITQIAKTYYVNGDIAHAEAWAERASFLMHSQELIFAEITHGKDLLSYFRFANSWYFRNLFYMACRITEDAELSQNGYGQRVFETLADLYDIVYPEGDAEFEMLDVFVTVHRCLAEDEANGRGDAEYIRLHLQKALFFAQCSLSVKTHKLQHALFKGIEVFNAPSDNKQIVRRLHKELQWDCFLLYRSTEWFTEMEDRLNKLI